MIAADTVRSRLDMINQCEDEEYEGPLWETPVPLDPTTGPPAPVDALPGILGEMVEAVAEETQTPPDLAMCVALGTLSTAAGGKYVVHVGISNQTEPVHLMLAPTAGPGNRKSAVFQRLTPPLRDFERDQQQQDLSRLEDWESKERVLVKQLNNAEGGGRSKRTSGNLTDSEAVRMAAVKDLREHREAKPVLTELYSDDATVEAVKEKMIEQRGAFAVLSAESSFLSISGGRYSSGGRKEPNLDAILNGHAADEIKITRKGKPTERTERACLTLCLMLQPFVFEAMGQVEGFRERGAAARFLPSFPADFIGSRRIETQPVPHGLIKAWGELLREVLEVERTGTPIVLQLDPEALGAYRQYAQALEPMIKSEGRYMEAWNSKLLGAILRIAGLLHIAIYPRPETRLIEADTFQSAIDLGTYFQAHARIMFRLMFGRKGQSNAASILEVLRKIDSDFISVRDLWQRVKNRADFERSDLDGELDVLEEHGWVRFIDRPAREGSAPGGRKSRIILLNPALRSKR